MIPHDYATLPFKNAHNIDGAIRGATEERKNNIIINIDDVKDLKIIYDANRVMVSRGKAPMATTFHSFGQLCQLTQSPTGFMRELGPLAVDVLAQRLTPGDKAQFIVYKVNANEGILRGITSQTYGRIWTLNILRSIEQQLQASSQYTLYFNLRQSERADTHIEIVDNTSREVQGISGKLVYRARLIRNSETGGRSASIDDLLVTETGQRFIIEGVEANRTYRHTMNALQRFQLGLNESMMRFGAPDFEQELFREAAGRIAGDDYEIAVGYAEQVCGMELPEIHVNKVLRPSTLPCANLRMADLLAEASMGAPSIDRKYELAAAAGMMLTAPENPRPDYDLRKAKIAALQQGRKQRSVQASRNRRAMKSMHGQLHITPPVKP